MAVDRFSIPQRLSFLLLFRFLPRFLFCVITFLLMAPAAFSAEVSDAEKLYLSGQYDQCIQLTHSEIKKGADGREWWEWKIRSEMARGKWEDAALSVEQAKDKFPYGLSFALMNYAILRQTGQEKLVATIQPILDRQILNGAFRDHPSERVAVGRYLFSRGTDAKQVLDQFYNAVSKQFPEQQYESFLAAAELSLAKNDRALAGETLAKAPKTAVRDPRYHFLLASALAEDNRPQAIAAISQALKINPHHADSLLWTAEQSIDAEDFDAAKSILKKALQIDGGNPRAWAYLAVIAHLQADAKGEAAARDNGLKRWGKNPEVDHLIGKKLSQDYRFREGANYQKDSLKKDPAYLPAKLQLCQDLLRLGEDQEGWKLASEVFAGDGYNVVAYNLVNLQDQLGKFKTIAGPGILLRMDPKEADLYGPRAMALLQRARKTLEAKYGAKLEKAVTVEIYPRKNDFAVRTFGLPGAEGFLGVCFGPLITANSPASQGKSPSNWEAVLWHEYCHTVTLHKTRNKMPRWLSEGISVYEETNENRSWGPWFNPKYREMVLGEDFTPLSRLSSAFMSPKSAMHVQFAYFESAMAVEFLIGKLGFPVLQEILEDLAKGLNINQSLERRSGGPLAKLDSEFATFARKKASDLAAEVTWEKTESKGSLPSKEWRAFLEKHPKNFWALQKLCAALLKEENWQEAEKQLRNLRKVYPEYVGADNAYEGLARVYRQAKKSNEETAILEECANRDGDALGVFQRLVELGEAREDWKQVAQNARRWLAVDPLTSAPHRALAKAAQNLGEKEEAIGACKAILALNPPDQAEIHFQLARLYQQSNQIALAKKEILQSLEEAPRSVDAHRLLAELNLAIAKPVVEKEKPKIEKENAPPKTETPPVKKDAPKIDRKLDPKEKKDSAKDTPKNADSPKKKKGEGKP